MRSLCSRARSPKLRFIGEIVRPTHSREIDLLLFVQTPNECNELTIDGIVWLFFEHIGRAVVCGVGTGIPISVGLLRIELATMMEQT